MKILFLLFIFICSDLWAFSNFHIGRSKQHGIEQIEFKIIDDYVELDLNSNFIDPYAQEIIIGKFKMKKKQFDSQFLDEIARIKEIQFSAQRSV